MNWLRNKLIRWMCHELDERLKTVEAHFVTKRDEHGRVTETLADVPLEQRKELKTPRMAGMSMAMRLAWLEKTDGGRLH